MEKTITKIAKDILGFSTLEKRNMDYLDFYDVSVWSVEKALKLAYEAGKSDEKRETFSEHNP